MRYAASYQNCTPPDDDAYWERLTQSVAGFIHDGDTEDDVCIEAHRIAYRVNVEYGLEIGPEQVRQVAGDAVYFLEHGKMP